MKILNTTKFPCIYLITNLINQKKYIGQTIRFKERIWEHENYHSTMAIHQAIQKYGSENFTVEVIETINDCENLAEKLDTLEQYYINFYDSYYHGYNATSGGQCKGQTRKSKNKIICFNYDYTEKLGEYENYSDAERQTGIIYVNIRYCVKNKNGKGNQMLHAGGLGWLSADFTQEELKYRQQQVLLKCFYSYQLDKNDQPIFDTEQKFFIQAEAAQLLGVNASSIKQILAHKAKTTKDKNGNKYTFSKISLIK